jgi:hypothetical protein
MMTIPCTFPWKKPSQSELYTLAVKWSQGNSKYEIYVATLEDMDNETLLPHCIDVKGNVQKEVSNDDHLGPSLFKVFPRTLSIPLMAVRDQSAH